MIEERRGSDLDHPAQCRKHEGDLAARDHPDRHGQLPNAVLQDSDCARQLPDDRRGSQRNRERQRRGLSKRVDVRAESHQHEEHGDEKRGHGLEQLAERPLTALDECVRMAVLQHETGGKCAYQGCESNRGGCPGQEEAETQARHEEGATGRQACSLSEPGGRQTHAERDGQDQETDGLHDQRDNRRRLRRRRLPTHPRRYRSKQHEPEHVVDHGRAEDDPGLVTA